jgi:hypothetical protein
MALALADQRSYRAGSFEPAAVASGFVANVARPGDPGPYAGLLDAYLARTRAAFAAAQSAPEAGTAIAAAAMSPDYRFRWQTPGQAASLVGLSLADIDDERVQDLDRLKAGKRLGGRDHTGAGGYRQV